MRLRHETAQSAQISRHKRHRSAQSMSPDRHRSAHMPLGMCRCAGTFVPVGNHSALPTVGSPPAALIIYQINSPGDLLRCDIETTN
jgi:hypothetical protein